MNSVTPHIVTPWGGYTVLKQSTRLTLQKWFVRAQACADWQPARYRRELCYVLSGSVLARYAGQKNTLHPGDVLAIERTRALKARSVRLCARTTVRLLKISFGKIIEKDLRKMAGIYACIGRLRHELPH